LEAVLKGTVRNLEENLRQRVLIWMPDGEELDVVEASAGLQITAADREAAIWTFRSRRPSGLGTDMLAGSSMLHLPIKSPTITEGVLSLSTDPESSLKHEQRWVLEACTNQIALAVERARLTKNAEETRLLMARKNLERVLLNSISHDLRTPLVTITGVLDSILDPGNRLPEAARHELLETAREEACRLNRFVGNLLDMTRLEAGAVSLKIEPGDIQDLIGCALSAVEPRLGNRRVNVQLMPDLPLVPFDLVLMTQVVVNLLDNACKLAPESTVIDISARLSDNRLCLEVADRGPGVPESEISRIFEKFYRVPVPEGVSGTGLGLSICRGIVEAHGGMISAHNREGGGLAVAVWLPLG
jgi:two-component system sensor histidine kinase KdpD